MPGVKDFITASAIPGKNCVDPKDGGANLKEKLFWEVGDQIPCVGVQLGIVVADDWEHARMAAKLVVQKYVGHGMVLKTTAEAQKLGRVPDPTDVVGAHALLEDPEFCRSRRVSKRSLWCKHDRAEASPEDAQKEAETVEATVSFGAQYHFYMETQAAFVAPYDAECWEVVFSTQDPSMTAINLASILGVPQHKLNIKIPRAGGGFGVKLTRHMMLAGACAVAAHKLNAPIHGQNERSDDMQMSSGREPINYGYTVKYDASGKVHTMDLKLTMAPGWFYGDCAGDMAMAASFADDCYRYDKFTVTSDTVLTDIPHGTSMRSPGAMNVGIGAQLVMEHVARSVGKAVEEVQATNFYHLGDTTPFGDTFGRDGFNFTVPLMWEKLKEDSNYAARQADIKDYNEKNRWTKKGIALSPVKYIMDMGGFSSGALVCIYEDGSIIVNIGGVEVGQGIHTKAALCAAQSLGVPLERILVGPTETARVPNNSCTGGSGTSENSCQAVLQACLELASRLVPYRRDGVSWESTVSAALDDHVSLMASSWFSWGKTGNAHAYATYGVGASEVLVDALTGEVRVERVDILMDLGTQLDAAIDIGQLQGGFMIALGYCFTEELKFNEKGEQLFLGSWEYKIPSAYDIPVEFNISLLKDTPNPRGVKGCKSCAEPVMALVSSTILAVKEALYAARKANGLNQEWFPLELPLTPQRVQAAAGTQLYNLEIPSQ